MARSKLTRCTFKVTGRVRFPFDMLRYDSCYPASERDSNVIEATTYDDKGPFEVELKSHSESVIYNGPTDARWRSFCWQVVPGSVRVD